MLVIPCPFCGPREEVEFRYRGDAGVQRPEAAATIEAFHAYVYERDNPAGLHREYWLHLSCRQVLAVERDTVSGRIATVRPARET